MRIAKREAYLDSHGTPYVNREAAKRFVADGYDGWISEYRSGNIYRIVNLDALNEAYRSNAG